MVGNISKNDSNNPEEKKATQENIKSWSEKVNNNNNNDKSSEISSIGT